LRQKKFGAASCILGEYVAMNSARFEHLMELDKSGRVEDVIRESQMMLAEATDANESASVLINMCVSYAKLGRLKEARQVLHQMKQLEISHQGIRLNAEFCEPTLLIQEGRREEGLAAFAAMLDQYSEAFKDPEHRYLYEDIQCRRASTLVLLSRFKEALPILKEALSFSFDEATDEQRVHFDLGICLEETTETEAAKQEYFRAIGFGFKNDIEERALYRLAVLYFKAGALAQAKQQLETILRDFPGQSSAVPRKYVYEQLSHTFRHLGDKANEKVYTELARRA
jgi:pentatricopeptide repeat protein